jgi:hypothetical protein
VGRSRFCARKAGGRNRIPPGSLVVRKHKGQRRSDSNPGSNWRRASVTRRGGVYS